MPSKRHPKEEEEEPEEEEEEEEFSEGEDILMDEDDDEDDDDDEYTDISSLMTGLLATESGETVCSALVKIGNQLEIQNKVLVKIASAVASKQK